jgi:CheY-like chemotaxis protein
MYENHFRILILDIDQDTLITLEQILEDAGFDTTTTWNQSEAEQLCERRYFDFLIVGDHPPEMDGAMVLRNVEKRGCCGACLVLCSDLRESEVKRFRALGAVAVISKQDRPSVLEQVRKCSRSPIFRRLPAPSTMTGVGREVDSLLDIAVYQPRSKTA